jgi:DNA-binding SARP family transcriptional activator
MRATDTDQGQGPRSARAEPVGSGPAAFHPKGRLRLLNGFELVCGAKPVSLPLSAQRVVAFLALHQRPLLRGFVAGTLWLDASEDRSSANLRSALWRIRRSGRLIVEANVEHLRLSPAIDVDLLEAMGMAQQLVQRRADAPADDGVVGLLSEELLPDWYDEWVAVERERYRQLRLHALEQLCDRLTRLGRFAQAVEAGLAAVTGEPLRESAHRALIRAHLAEGNRGEALRQYDTYRCLVRDELGIEPSRRMEALVLAGGSEPSSATPG